MPTTYQSPFQAAFRSAIRRGSSFTTAVDNIARRNDKSPKQVFESLCKAGLCNRQKFNGAWIYFPSETFKTSASTAKAAQTECWQSFCEWCLASGQCTPEQLQKACGSQKDFMAFCSKFFGRQIKGKSSSTSTKRSSTTRRRRTTSPSSRTRTTRSGSKSGTKRTSTSKKRTGTTARKRSTTAKKRTGTTAKKRTGTTARKRSTTAKKRTTTNATAKKRSTGTKRSTTTAAKRTRSAAKRTSTGSYRFPRATSTTTRRRAAA